MTRTLQDECYFMSTVGECESNPAFMRVTCAASCGFCDEEAEVSTTGVAVGAHGEASESTDPPALPSASIVLVRSGSELEVVPLGLPPSDHVVAMEAGELHMVVLTALGAVFSWGDGQLRQLGRPAGASRLPYNQRAPHRLQWPHPHSGTPATAISAGHMHSGAVLRGGALLMWGDNSHGQCGVAFEDTTDAPNPSPHSRPPTRALVLALSPRRSPSPKVPALAPAPNPDRTPPSTHRPSTSSCSTRSPPRPCLCRCPWPPRE